MSCRYYQCHVIYLWRTIHHPQIPFRVLISYQLRYTRFEEEKLSYADHAMGPSRAEQIRAVALDGKGRSFWFLKVLIYFHLTSRKNGQMSWDFAMFRYFEITALIGILYPVLYWLYFRWVADYEAYHSINLSVYSACIFDGGECYGVLPFSFVLSVCHIVRSNCCVSFFTPLIPSHSNIFLLIASMKLEHNLSFISI